MNVTFKREPVEDAISLVRTCRDKLFPKDTPEGLSPEFYQTLSYKGDMEERERFDNAIRLLRILLPPEAQTNDMKNKKCTNCHEGVYQEVDIHSAMKGQVHCSNCDVAVQRWQA